MLCLPSRAILFKPLRAWLCDKANVIIRLKAVLLVGVAVFLKVLAGLLKQLFERVLFGALIIVTFRLKAVDDHIVIQDVPFLRSRCFGCGFVSAKRRIM